MDLTYAIQFRNATVTDRVAYYYVDMHITDRGELPDKHVFVKTIVNETDPKSDVFRRVARVGDLTTYPSSREEAIREEVDSWRDSHVYIQYEDIEEAKVAYKFLQEKVNDLVDEFTSYIEDFEKDSGELISFPDTAAGILTPRVQNYDKAKKDREEKEKEVSDKKIDCSSVTERHSKAIVELSAARDVRDKILETKNTLVSVKSSLLEQVQVSNNISTDIEQAIDEWRTHRGDVSGDAQVAMDDVLQEDVGVLYSNYVDEFRPAVSRFQRDLSAVDDAIVSIQTELTQQEEKIDSLKSKRKDLLADKEACAEDIALSEAELEALEQIEDNALGDVQSLCPDFEAED